MDRDCQYQSDQYDGMIHDVMIIETISCKTRINVVKVIKENEKKIVDYKLQEQRKKKRIINS